MKKTLAIIFIVIVLVLIFALLKPGSPSSDIPSADSVNEPVQNQANVDLNVTNSGEVVTKITNALKNVNFVVTGYGPGKSHDGTFTNYTVSNVTVTDKNVLNSATITVDASSRVFEIAKLNERLNDHLCSDDFLSCTAYPEMVFELKSVTQNSENSFTANGDLTMKGITKPVSVPVSKNGDIYSTEVRLNIRQFGIGYLGVDDEVLIKISTK